MSKKNDLDQYYTNPDVAYDCWENILKVFDKTSSFFEPSAGMGVFLREDLNITAVDLEPKVSGIEMKDFFTVDKMSLKGKVVVGNPPYGWASSLALRFINHSSEAEGVCFILPRTFKKVLFQQKIDDNLHLVFEKDLPFKSFNLNGEPYDVPSCFQIWKRLPYKRDKISYDNLITAGTDKDYDINIRRVGGRAGKIVSDSDYTKSTTYRVKLNGLSVTEIESIYPEIKREASNTAGVRSITLDEINYLLTKRRANGTQVYRTI